MNQKSIAYEHLHDPLQGRLMRQGMEWFQVEYLLIDSLERRIRIAAGCTDIGHALHRIAFRKQPALCV
jgi:hypothetical protein